MEAARRLDSLSMSEGEVFIPPTPVSARTPHTPAAPTKVPWWNQVLAMFVEDPKAQTQVFTKADILSMRRNVDLLKSMASSLELIWNFSLDSPEAFFTEPLHEDPLFSPFIEEETEYQAVAPGVWAPHSKATHELTWRGKEQV